jgi:CheY-like chemotaxis protein
MHRTQTMFAGANSGAQSRSEEMKTRKILIVEDNTDNAESLRLLLQFFGHDVWVAPTGPEGVRLAQANRPDIILCDIGLPGLDGFGVATAVRQDPATAHAYLVAITGYGSDQTRSRCGEVGFDRYFTKPIDPDLLVELVAGAPGPRA